MTIKSTLPDGRPVSAALAARMDEDWADSRVSPDPLRRSGITVSLNSSLPKVATFRSRFLPTAAKADIGVFSVSL